MEFLMEYGLFLAKTLTVIAGIILIVVVMLALGARGRKPDTGHIDVRNLNEKLKATRDTLKRAILSPEQLKQEIKDEKREEKRKRKETKKRRGDDEQGAVRPRLYVLDFEGDLQASPVAQLREEITAVVTMVRERDEVLVRLESAGGMVHSYGLAASQILRLKEKGTRVTIAVDKVAASGGYMMACVADRIIAAPFALVGSIGVVAQIPNFHRLLEKNEIDFDVLTAGEYKRTLTFFGENTEQGRKKFVEELEDIHALFKEHVAHHRPALQIDEVATGEAWYGTRALQRNLVDELKTSDSFILECCDDFDVYEIAYVDHRSRMERLMERFNAVANRVLGRLLVA